MFLFRVDVTFASKSSKNVSTFDVVVVVVGSSKHVILKTSFSNGKMFFTLSRFSLTKSSANRRIANRFPEPLGPMMTPCNVRVKARVIKSGDLMIKNGKYFV